MSDRSDRDRAYYLANKAAIAAKKAAYQKRERVAVNARQAKYRDSNRDRVRKLKRDHQRKRLYGADPDAVRQLLVAQDFKCAICGRPIDERADLDHDHATGRIRGLLDRRCNIWLAALEDPAFEAAAKAYLARFRP